MRRDMESGNYLLTTSDKPKGWPQLLSALKRLDDEAEADPSLVPEMARATLLLERVNGVEFVIDDWAPDKPVAFTLIDAETRSANLAIPEDPTAQVVCRDTGRKLGTLRDIEALGSWLWAEMNRSHHAHLARHAALLRTGNRRDRRAAKVRR